LVINKSWGMGGRGWVVAGGRGGGIYFHLMAKSLRCLSTFAINGGVLLGGSWETLFTGEAELKPLDVSPTPKITPAILRGACWRFYNILSLSFF